MEQQSIISFLMEIEKFKTCERTCRTSQPGRAESDAEHTWHLALFLMSFEHRLAGLDTRRILKLALIHDLPELYAGDANPYRDHPRDKEARELRAARELFARLPPKVGGEFIALFEEYVAQKTPEAKVVKAADKLLPLIQNLCTNQEYSSYRHLKVRYEEVEQYMDRFFPHDGWLRELYRDLLSQAHCSGVFYDRPDQA